MAGEGRFRLVQAQGGAYIVQDMTEASSPTLGMEMLTEAELAHAIQLGLKIDGVTPVEGSRQFNYSTEFFINMGLGNTEEEEDFGFDDEEDSDFGMDDEGYEDEDGFADEGDDYSSDEPQSESYEDDGGFAEDTEEYDDGGFEEEYEDDGGFGFEEDYDDGDGDANSQFQLYQRLEAAMGGDKNRMEALSMYYTYRSKLLFSEAVNNGTVKSNLTALARGRNANYMKNKMATMQALRGADGVWTYAYFIDTGYLGGGTCTLGHRLRFQHIAIDVNRVSEGDLIALSVLPGDGDTVNASYHINSSQMATYESQGALIRFGINCLADFFEVDPETIKGLKEIQRVAIDEMAELMEIYESGKAEDVKKSYAFFDELMQYLTVRDARRLATGKPTLLSSEENALYTRFKELGMVYPRSFIRSIRQKIFGIPVRKYTRSNMQGRKVDMEAFCNMVRDYIHSRITCDAEVFIGALLSNPVKFDFYRGRATMLASLGALYVERLCFFGMMGYYRYNDDIKKRPDLPYNVDDGGRSAEIAAYFAAREKNEHKDFANIDVTKIPYTIEALKTVAKLYAYTSQFINFRKALNDYRVGKDTENGQDVDFYKVEEIPLDESERPYSSIVTDRGIRKSYVGQGATFTPICYYVDMKESGASGTYNLIHSLYMKKYAGTDDLDGTVRQLESALSVITDTVILCNSHVKAKAEAYAAELNNKAIEEQKKKEEEQKAKEEEAKAEALRRAEALKKEQEEEQLRLDNFNAAHANFPQLRQRVEQDLMTKPIAIVVASLSDTEAGVFVRGMCQNDVYKTLIQNKCYNALPLAITETMYSKTQLEPTERQYAQLVKGVRAICEKIVEDNKAQVNVPQAAVQAQAKTLVARIDATANQVKGVIDIDSFPAWAELVDTLYDKLDTIEELTQFGQGVRTQWAAIVKAAKNNRRLGASERYELRMLAKQLQL